LILIKMDMPWFRKLNKKWFFDSTANLFFHYLSVFSLYRL